MEKFNNLFSELHQKVADDLKEKSIMFDERPFDELFGDSIRISEPLKGKTEYAVDIEDLIGYEYSVDIDNWKVYKPTDTEKKNPIKLGKALNKQLQLYKKELKKINDSISEMEGDEDEEGDGSYNPPIHNIVGQHLLSRKENYEKSIERLETLLKTSNLEKQSKQQKISFYIVYTRNRIDVARMSDHEGIESCHAPKHPIKNPSPDYFHCAMADALGMGAVAYLITDKDYEKIKDKLNTEDEIFDDMDRGIEGIKPLARFRYRKIEDEDGNELAVPLDKIYAVEGYQFNNDFIAQCINFAKKQDESKFDFDSLITLRGGSYQDIGYELDNLVAGMWGKEIRYTIGDDDGWLEDELSRDDYFSDIPEDEYINMIKSELHEGAFKSVLAENLAGSNRTSINISFDNLSIYRFVLENTLIQKINDADLTTDELYLGNNDNSFINIKKEGSSMVVEYYYDGPSINDFVGADESGQFNFDDDAFAEKFLSEFYDTAESILGFSTLSPTKDTWDSEEYLILAINNSIMKTINYEENEATSRGNIEEFKDVLGKVWGTKEEVVTTNIPKFKYIKTGNKISSASKEDMDYLNEKINNFHSFLENNYNINDSNSFYNSLFVYEVNIPVDSISGYSRGEWTDGILFRESESISVPTLCIKLLWKAMENKNIIEIIASDNLKNILMFLKDYNSSKPELEKKLENIS